MIESTRWVVKGRSSKREIEEVLLERETFETDFESVAVIGNMKV